MQPAHPGDLASQACIAAGWAMMPPPGGGGGGRRWPGGGGGGGGGGGWGWGGGGCAPGLPPDWPPGTLPSGGCPPSDVSSVNCGPPVWCIGCGPEVPCPTVDPVCAWALTSADPRSLRILIAQYRREPHVVACLTARLAQLQGAGM